MQCNAGKELHPDLQQVADYCKQFAPRQDAQKEANCRLIVENLVPNPYHQALILNLAPETTDELLALIPELQVRCCNLARDAYANTRTALPAIKSADLVKSACLR